LKPLMDVALKTVPKELQVGRQGGKGAFTLGSVSVHAAFSFGKWADRRRSHCLFR